MRREGRVRFDAGNLVGRNVHPVAGADVQARIGPDHLALFVPDAEAITQNSEVGRESVSAKQQNTTDLAEKVQARYQSRYPPMPGPQPRRSDHWAG